MDKWRIKRIPYDQFGNMQYHRAYGWGWLSPIGVIGVIVATTALLINVKIDDDYLLGAMFASFITVCIGIVCNGFSERKSMILMDAKCIDVQVNHIGSTRDRTADWAVRAVVEYEYNGKTYQSTPMPKGYAMFCFEESAVQFGQYLLDTKSVKVYVDPKRLKRSLFHDCDIAKKSSHSTAPVKTMSGIKLCYLIITYLLGFMGLFLFSGGMLGIKDYNDAKKWPYEMGHITESKISYSYGMNKWHYILNGTLASGKPFTIKRVSYDRKFREAKERARAVVSKYPVGTTLKVYSFEGQSILDIDPDGILHEVTAVGGVLAFHMLLVFIIGRRKQGVKYKGE